MASKEEARAAEEENRQNERADEELAQLLDAAEEMEAAQNISAEEVSDETAEEISEEIADDNAADIVEPRDMSEEILEAVSSLAEMVTALAERVDEIGRGLPAMIAENSSEPIGTGDALDGEGAYTDSVGARSLEELVDIEKLDLT